MEPHVWGGMPAWCIAKAEKLDKKFVCVIAVIAGAASSDPRVLHTQGGATRRKTCDRKFPCGTGFVFPGTRYTRWYQETRWYHLYSVPPSNKAPSVPSTCIGPGTPRWTTLRTSGLSWWKAVLGTMLLSILKPELLDMMNVRELMKDLVRISAPEISYDMEEVLMDCFVKKNILQLWQLWYKYLEEFCNKCI